MKRIIIIFIIVILLPLIYYYGKYVYIMNSPNMGIPVKWYCDYPNKIYNYNPKIFIGVFTTENNYIRRKIIRETYLKKKPDDIILKFIIGKIKDKSILEEIDEYHDIISLDIKENMNKGKTFEYFYTISEIFEKYPLDFVIKADDDSYLNLDLIKKDLSITPSNMTYWGYLVANSFMGGECYGLSFDLVKWIHNSPIPRKYKEGHEDSQVQKWFEWGNIDNNIKYHVRNCKIQDDILANTVYSRELKNDTMVLHYIKSNERFINIHYKIENKHITKISSKN